MRRQGIRLAVQCPGRPRLARRDRHAFGHRPCCGRREQPIEAPPRASVALSSAFLSSCACGQLCRLGLSALPAERALLGFALPGRFDWRQGPKSQLLAMVCVGTKRGRCNLRWRSIVRRAFHPYGTSESGDDGHVLPLLVVDAPSHQIHPHAAHLGGCLDIVRDLQAGSNVGWEEPGVARLALLARSLGQRLAPSFGALRRAGVKQMGRFLF